MTKGGVSGNCGSCYIIYRSSTDDEPAIKEGWKTNMPASGDLANGKTTGNQVWAAKKQTSGWLATRRPTGDEKWTTVGKVDWIWTA